MGIGPSHCTSGRAGRAGGGWGGRFSSISQCCGFYRRTQKERQATLQTEGGHNMGWVSHADWQFGYELPFTGSLAGGGLIIDCAFYKGRLVLLRGSAPFAIVPYHEPSGPFFKDG